METGLCIGRYNWVSDTGEILGTLTDGELQLIPTLESSDELMPLANMKCSFSCPCKINERSLDFLVYGVCSRWRTRRKAREFIKRKLNKAN